MLKIVGRGVTLQAMALEGADQRLVAEARREAHDHLDVYLDAMFGKAMTVRQEIEAGE